jgi:hypothetical protein
MADNTKQLIDLSRSIDKLSVEIKKNTEVTRGLGETQSDLLDKGSKGSASPLSSGEGLKDLKALTDEIKKMNLGDIAKSIKDLNPKNISDLLKGPISSIVEATKGKGVSDITEKISGEVGKKGKGFNVGKILGAFQEGGIADAGGQYLVGENGPEVVKLPKGAGVIPINVKDLIEGLSKVPELAEIVKDGKDTVNFFGNESNPSVIDSKGKLINLSTLSDKYGDKAGETKNKSKLDIIDKILENIDALSSTGSQGIENEISRINNEEALLSGKSKLSGEDLRGVNRIWDDILQNIRKDGEYYNPLSIAKAKLLATQTFVKENKKGEEGSKKTEELSADLQKESEAELKKQTEDLKKAQEVINPKPTKTEGAAGKEAGGEAGKEAGGEAKKSKFKEKIKDVFQNVKEKGEKLFKAGKDKLKGGAESIKTGGEELLPSPAEKTAPGFKKSTTALLKSYEASIGSNKESVKKALANEGLGELSTPLKETPKKAEKTEKAGKTPEAKTGEKTTQPGQDLSKDLSDIKLILTRIASSLDGPLEVSPIDSPFRPDSRKV